MLSRSQSLLEPRRSPLELPSVAASAQRNSQLSADEDMLVITGALNRLEDPFTLYEKSE